MSGGLLTAAAVRRLLAEHGIAAHKQRGQNFVVDPNIVRKVVRDAGVRPGALVCEIGPGLGSLTLALREAGARVVAVEVDAGLVRALRHVLADDAGVEIVHADVLSTDLAELLDGGPAQLVANLPYNIATPLVFHALDGGVFTQLFVMVQREVGERWAAEVGHPAYGAVSIKMSALATVVKVARVSRAAFYPVPNVDSLTVRVTPTPWALAVDRATLFPLVEAGFAQRRKRLRNALGAAGRTPQDVESALLEAHLPLGARGEELGLQEWAALAAALRC